MKTPVNDLTGKKFGRLTPIEYVEIKGKHNKWLCSCDCGCTTLAQASDLTSGRKQSCGCLRREMIAKFNVETKTLHGESGGHGKKRSRLYVIWMGMIQRCENPTHDHDFKYYAEKGITVCEEWHDYSAFRDWALKNGYKDIYGERAERMSIDRINAKLGYYPENCRWVTLRENIIYARQANQR